jgi:predicted outer membrane protein
MVNPIGALRTEGNVLTGQLFAPKPECCGGGGSALRGRQGMVGKRIASNAGYPTEHRHMEIQAAKLALSKQPDGDTKPFAERMVKDHEHTSMELKALVGSGKVNADLPIALDAEHQREIDELNAKSGKEFDRAYDPMQVKAHQQAVELFETYARDGDNADLKAWAAKTLPHLKQHLAMAKKLTS